MSEHFSDTSDSAPAIRTPPPPGFFSDQPDVVVDEVPARTGNKASYYGEAMRGAQGSLSAPLPPGFIDGSSDVRRKQAWGAVDTTVTESDSWMKTLLPPGVLSSNSGGTVPTNDANGIYDQRTSSFVNLVDALGTGLAECMDKSFQDGSNHKSLTTAPHRVSSLAAAVASGSANNGYDGSPRSSQNDHGKKSGTGIDLNYARQSRHAASRFLGSSPSNSTVKTGNSSAAPQGYGQDSYHPTMGAENPSAFSKSPGERRGSHDTFLRGMSSPPQSSTPVGLFSNAPGSLSMDPTITVVEPAYYDEDRTSAVASSRSSPGLPTWATSQNYQDNEQHPFLTPSLFSASLEEEGRSSAPPKMNPSAAHWNHPQGHGRVEANHRIDNASTSSLQMKLTSLQLQAAELKQLVDREERLSHVGISRNSIGGGSVSSGVSTPHRSSGVSTPHRSFSPTPATAMEHQAKEELEPFIWNSSQSPSSSFRNPVSPLSNSSMNNTRRAPSRALVIMFASSLHVPDVRSTCEAFGVLETFRSDFMEELGVIFVGYYDIRSAKYAALELQACLQRLTNRHEPIEVHYCVPLNVTSSFDESLILLSNMPDDMDESALTNILSSYGAIRDFQHQQQQRGGGLSYLVEFYNIQDAKHALLELESTQPWGLDVSVEVGMRSPSERKRGRELLALIGRWRHGDIGHAAGATPRVVAAGHTMKMSLTTNSSNSASPPAQNPDPSAYKGFGVNANNSQSSIPAASHQGPMTQLVIGPDGQYSYIMLPSTTSYQPASFVDQHTGRLVHSAPHQQQYVMGPHGQYLAPIPTGSQQQPHQQVYWPPHQHGPDSSHHQHAAYHLPPGSIITGPPHLQRQGQVPHGYGGGRPGYTVNSARAQTDSSASSGGSSNPQLYYGHHPNEVVNMSSLQNASLPQRDPGPFGGPSSPLTSTTGSKSDNDKRDQQMELFLDIAAVQVGRDTRTSLMVRNIPNKYTQQMLLSEFSSHGHGPGKIDFFYLPIDFKNRCNRGYAFINFVDYRDIVPFHQQYFGKTWKVFNSEKVCDVTYARIQGKAGMLKRFENSSLMEKEDAYKPLVFSSHGEEKGKPMAFP